MLTQLKNALGPLAPIATALGNALGNAINDAIDKVLPPDQSDSPDLND